jgi:hypothetical protein
VFSGVFLLQRFAQGAIVDNHGAGHWST